MINHSETIAAAYNLALECGEMILADNLHDLADSLGMTDEQFAQARHSDRNYCADRIRVVFGILPAPGLS